MTCKTVMICPYCGEDTREVWPGILACEWCYVWWAEPEPEPEPEPEAEAERFWSNERDRFWHERRNG
jgi:hypothetical protein